MMRINEVSTNNISGERRNSRKTSGRSLAKVLSLLLITALLIIPQFGCGSNDENVLGGLLNQGENDESSNLGISMNNFLLDTICTITVYGIDNSDNTYDVLNEEGTLKEHINNIISGCFTQCRDYENLLSKTIEGSDVYRINHAGGKAVQVSEITMEIIKKGLEYGELSGGCFDISCGTETGLWNFRGNEDGEYDESCIASAEDLKEAAKHVDYTRVIIDEKNMTVQLEDPEMQLDLGGIAKGYIADRAAVYLEGANVKAAVVDFGGNIVVIGGKTKERLIENIYAADNFSDVVIGIKDPTGEMASGLIGTYPSRDLTLVSSGTYERAFELDGVRYHHILDPRTGWPADTDVLQVTIIMDRGHSVDCDGLSTTCLALGVEKGTELINSLSGTKGYENLEAIFVDAEGNVTFTNPETKYQDQK